jgi:hypothetical protein
MHTNQRYHFSIIIIFRLEPPLADFIKFLSVVLEYVARMAKIRSAYKILVGKPEGKNRSEDLRVNRRNIID